MIAPFALLLLVAVAMQIVFLLRLGPRTPVGDEVEYLDHADSSNPYASAVWLRPPLMFWLASLCFRNSANGELRLRALMSGFSIGAVVLTVVAGWALGGPIVAFVAGLFLVFQPERIVLGCHIWPDTVLALILSALNLLLVLPFPNGPGIMLVAGILCALGALTRIDLIIAAPVVLAALWVGGRPLPLLEALLLVGPTLAIVVGLSLRNYRRHGIALPDTTWAFNLTVSELEVGEHNYVGFALDPLVRRAMTRWKELTPASRVPRGRQALAALVKSPSRFLRGTGRRLLTLCGPDTFVRQKLIASDGAYSELRSGPRRFLGVALQVGFPALLALAVISSLFHPDLLGAYVWPSLAMMAASAAFHARTRYRVAILPTLSLVAAKGAATAFETLQGPTSTALFLLGVNLLLAALLRINCSTERNL